MRRLASAFGPLLGLALGTLTAPAAEARNVVYHLPLQQVLASDDFRARVGSDVPFTFGGPSASSSTSPQWTFVVEGKASIKSITDEQACVTAMINALRELRSKVKAASGNAAVGVVSYDRRREFASDTQYECHAGSHSVRVTLRGTAATSTH
jgi:hypothetical protein